MQEKGEKQSRENTTSALASDCSLKSFCWRKAGTEHYLISLLIRCNSIRVLQALLLAVVSVMGLIVAKDCLDWLRQIYLFINRRKTILKKMGIKMYMGNG